MTAVEWATTVPFPLCRRHLFFETRWQKFYEFLTQVMARFELPNRMSRLDALHTRVLVAVLGHLRIWQFPRINLTRCTAVLGSEIPFAEACHDGRLLKGDHRKPSWLPLQRERTMSPLRKHGDIFFTNPAGHGGSRAGPVSCQQYCGLCLHWYL